MASANIEGVATSSTLSGNLTVTPPSGVVPGELLLAVIAADNDPGSAMTGWTKLGWGSNGAQGATVWGRQATGSDAGTITPGLARFGNTYRISGWGGTLVAGGASGDVRVVHGTTNTLDPPNAAAGSTADLLVLAVARNNAAISGPPTDFTLNPATTTSFVGVTLAVGQRKINASGQNPGAFAGSASSAHACTILVLPGPYPRRTSGAMLAYL